MTDPAKPAAPGVVARRHAPRALLVAGLALSPAAALAESEARPTVSEVTVTAPSAAPRNTLSKLPEDLRQIPQSVTVLDHALLQAEGVSGLADALKTVPGITLGGAEGGQIGNNINLNGFNARTDLYLDGFRDRGQYYRDTFALESVQVLMGPSSMLFGRGSTGGAVNQASKQAGLTPRAEVELSQTSNGLSRGVGDVNAPLSDHAAVRLSVMAQDGAASTRRQTTVDDYGLSPTYRGGIGDATEITLLALLQHNRDRPDYGQPPLNGRPAPVGRDAVYGYATDRTIQDVRAVSGQVKHAFALGLTLRDQLQFNGVDVDAIETAPHAVGSLGARGFTTPAAGVIASPRLANLWVELQSHDRVIHDTALFNQAEASGTFEVAGFKHDLLIGTEVGHDAYVNQGYSRTGACNGAALPSGYTGCVTLLNPAYTASPILPETPGNLAGGKADTAAAYVSDTLSLSPRLQLVGGLRHDRYAASISNSVNSANTPGNTAFASLSQTVDFTSVRGGAIWHPTQAQAYYVSYSTSFDPSLEQLTSTTGLSQSLPPEDSAAYEAGAKWALLHGRLDLDAAAFQITQDHARSQNADNTYTADGTIRVRGMRLSVSGRLNRRWQVFGGYSHLDAHIIHGIAPGTQGKTPQNTPSDSATLWATYDLSPHLQASGGALYMSRRWLNNTNLVSVPAYARLDAALAWRQAHYDLRLNLFNMADARYFDTLIASDGGRATPGAGRTAMISLVWRP